MNIQLPLVTQEKKQYPQNHLQTLLDGFCDFSGVENCGLSFKGLSLNSKKVHEEFMFLACAGVGTNSHHGVAYAGEAINLGASCIVWEPTAELQSMPDSCAVKDKADVPLIKVEALRDKVGIIAARFYNHPSRAMNVIGVTGTNGKTSTAHFIAQLIHALNEQTEDAKTASQKRDGQCAVIGTLGNGLYGKLEESTHTTPDAITVHSLLADFQQQAKTVVMEVSSHALAQGRVNGVEFDVAVFTNLTRDHLDFHGDMKRYAEEKLKLFKFRTLKQVVVNQDDAFASEIIDYIRAQGSALQTEVKTCSRSDSNSDYYARNIKLGHNGISFNLSITNASVEQKQYQVNSHLVGDFNIDNLLAAIAVTHQQGYEIEKIISVIARVNTVPGRMEKIVLEDLPEQGSQLNCAKADLPLVVVDYAHTPDALEKGLSALRAHTRGKLFCVFGCGGDRDKGKRPLMAKVAEMQADHIMVTSDNPRTESGEQIIAEIVSGFSNMDKVLTENDRQQAIHKTLQMAGGSDVVFIAGKGHEDYQEINCQRFPFSDKASVISFYSNGKVY